MIEYGDDVALRAEETAAEDDADNALVAAGLETDDDTDVDTDDEIVDVPASAVDEALSNLPSVAIRHDAVPGALQPSRFLGLMVKRVIDATPVDRHEAARDRLESPRQEDTNS